MDSAANHIDSTWLRRFNRVVVADATERLIVLSVYCWLVWRLVMPIVEGRALGNFFILISEGLVVAFLLFRRPATQISSNWRTWVLALLATLAPMLVNPSNGPSLVPVLVGAALLMIGMVIQIHAKLTLGRSFGCVPAHRGLRLAGPYRFVRHPMYAGYLLSHAAYLLLNPTLHNSLVYALAYSLQIPRLLEEEQLLSNDPQYLEYRRAVPCRLIPGLF
jgi:protein-S-isoprenylcysteine O-methyltransferase Ste14